MKQLFGFRHETADEILKETKGRCTICLRECPAQVIKRGTFQKKIYLRRTCPEHGAHEYCISSDARFYWLAKGDRGCSGGSCCSASGSSKGTLGRNATLDTSGLSVEERLNVLSTCLALIEIVDSCNLACPTCFADSPVGVGGQVKASPFEDITGRIQCIIDGKGKIELLQLSGGEPTLHPKFFEIVEWVRTNPGIDYLLVNTNGVKIARDEAFARRLCNTFRKYDNIQLYLQFDGVDPQVHQILRGKNLTHIKAAAIERCREAELPITLAMTVVSENLEDVWSTVNYGLEHAHVRGVSFQPMFLSGRVHDAEKKQPINAADIVTRLIGHSAGLFTEKSLTSLPCGDPNCAIIGWIFRLKDRYYSVEELGIDLPKLQATIPDRINYTLEDLRKCGCENTRLGELLKKFELKETNAFRIFIKPFMDARTWDSDRIDRCCTHVIRPDGQLDSFCRYYSGFPDSYRPNAKAHS